MGKQLIFTLGLVLTFAATVRADVTVSDGSITNFQAAVSNIVAAGGGTITVTKPIKIGDTNGTQDDETFDGESVVTVSGGNTNAIFVVQSGSLTLANMTIANGVGRSAGAISVSNGAAATFSNCIFANNRALGADGISAVTSTNGAGDVAVGKNGVRGTAGGSVAGGAIYSLGDLAIFECKFLSNSVVGGSGGDGSNGQSAGTRGGNGGSGGAGGTATGGAVCSLGPTLVISNSTFSANDAKGGSGGLGGIGGGAIVSGANGFSGLAGVASGGGLYTASPSALILNSTFDNNTTAGGDASTGGTSGSGVGQAGPRGGDALGAGVANAGGLNITNCTFYQNGATGGAGGDGSVGGVKGGLGGAGGNAIGGGIYNAGTIIVVNCTFSKGDATGGSNGTGGSGAIGGKNGKPGGNFGGNIANVAKKKKTGFTLANSIIGEATSGNGAYGKIVDGGYNIIADKSIKFKKTSTSLMNTNALEAGGDIADNGGDTETIALDVDSPAVDMIPVDLSGVTFIPPSTDQRGDDRPIGNGFDVGAYELDPDRVVILSQPADTNVTVGSNATFSVTVGGASPLVYQWFFNGSALADQTNSSVLITNAQPAAQGGFQVVITNMFNAVTSRVAQLKVGQFTNSPPGFSQEPPARQDAFVGTNVTISATVTSAVPVFYQWYYTDQGTFTTRALAGAITNFLVLTNVQITNSGIYQLFATNAFGWASSSLSVLVVNTNSATTNTSGSPPVPNLRAIPAMSKSSLKAAKHKSVLMKGVAAWDAEPNRTARRQVVVAGYSFPEPRRNVSSLAPTGVVFNRRLVYL